MAAFSNAADAFYDDRNSPRAYRNQVLNRQASGADPYNNMNPQMYGAEAPMSNMRYDSMRDGFGAPMHNAGAGNNHFPYDASAAQTWSAGGASLAPFGTGMGNLPQNANFGPSRSIKPSRGRVGLQQLWYDQPQQMQQQHPAIVGHRQGPQGRNDMPEDDDELIPTAIVIKNIPFAVKKEQLVQLMVDMNLPLPYAFNYHFDNGVFRGLAFANFTSPQETEQVIQALNHMDLSGRKLRVEYKKMLPLAERERIEREKRERRGQLEEQHRPLPQSQLHNQISLSSMSRNTPSPLSTRAGMPGELNTNSHLNTSLTEFAEVDMNDQKTLEFYTEMMMFRRDSTREVLIFPATLEPEHRRVVHTLAHHMGLTHVSRGTGDQRQVHIHRVPQGPNVSPPTLPGAFGPNEGLRQTLGRSSTADFNDSRPFDGHAFNTLRGQSSVGLLDVMDPNAYGRSADSNLRNAKSFADLRSWSPSPVPSTASFPAALQTNGARLQALNDTAGSNTPTLTPTASNAGPGVGRDEPPFLISGLSNLSLTHTGGSQTSPRRQRSFFGNGAEWNDSQNYQVTAPIGSKRTVSIGPESTTQATNPLRQARGPTSNNTIGFRRPNGRGSDELRAAASAIAE
ncbi:Peptidyl-prolyl cis-trans isomerase pin4 [Cladophialophora chaetospira]|uniref:Peptidyl-prolyl cis-trans isomerase pin4 n=1 Tax=Cladophialophora chaetospira TaxID=386627 RepID=A0AA39CBA4_9EURO|nr:Peptidyl-prolyl cis-trans isomerase pin4 [Cladophialophora chaetospira]